MSEELKRPIETNVYPVQKKRKPIIKKIIVVSLAVAVVAFSGRFACNKYEEYRETIYNPEKHVVKEDKDKYSEVGKELKSKLEKGVEGERTLSRYFINNEEDGSITLYSVLKNEYGPTRITKYIVDGKGETSFEKSLEVVSNANLVVSEHYHYDMMKAYAMEENKSEYMPELKEHLKQGFNYVSVQNGYYKTEDDYNNKTVTWTVGCWVRLESKNDVKIIQYEWEVISPYVNDRPVSGFDNVLKQEGVIVKTIKCQEMSDNFIRSVYIGEGIIGIFDQDAMLDDVIDIRDGNWIVTFNNDLIK